MSQQNLLFVVISIFSAPESRGGVREEIPDRAPVVGAGVCPEPPVTLRARAGADWSQRRLRLADARGRGRGGNGMRYEMVYTHPGARYITTIFLAFILVFIPFN